MITRRNLLVGGAAITAVPGTATPSSGQGAQIFIWDHGGVFPCTLSLRECLERGLLELSPESAAYFLGAWEELGGESAFDYGRDLPGVGFIPPDDEWERMIFGPGRVAENVVVPPWTHGESRLALTLTRFVGADNIEQLMRPRVCCNWSRRRVQKVGQSHCIRREPNQPRVLATDVFK